MMTITRVGPLSVAKIAGVLYAVIGLVIGAVFSLFAMVGGLAAAANNDGAGGFAAIFGMGAIILLPIFYGCLGFVMTAIMAALFNVVAGIVGGVEIDAR
jgi:hypothetical protein